MYTVIETIAEQSQVATAAVCDTLQVCRSAYYAWRAAAPTAREERDQMLSPLVNDIFWEHRRRYGTRRIAAELASNGILCSPRKVAEIMGQQGLRAIQPKSFKPKTTDSRHRLGYSPNLLLNAAEPTRIDQLWVGDITYIDMIDRAFSYLAMLMDRYSRFIVGWSMNTSMTDTLTLDALQNALRRRRPPSQVIHHTDRGGQYASRRYREVLRRADFQQSMNRADNCYDNAFMESCFGTIKNELQMTEYKHLREAEREIAEYIRYYNHQRRHSALNYLTPAQFEQPSPPNPR